MIDFVGQQGNRRQLLVTQYLFHVLAQRAAGVERQRPDADQENDQRKQGDSGLQRPPPEDTDVHADFTSSTIRPTGQPQSAIDVPCCAARIYRSSALQLGRERFRYAGNGITREYAKPPRAYHELTSALGLARPWRASPSRTTVLARCRRKTIPGAWRSRQSEHLTGTCRTVSALGRDHWRRLTGVAAAQILAAVPAHFRSFGLQAVFFRQERTHETCTVGRYCGIRDSRRQHGNVR
ncbi:MAG: hypothetical protein AW12_02972 [Candidatus Accumulibacter sp. BA-94]|nr:MAG: hypothetical protein AW12_02972 [Candidatus Accumulibacter sp. BA-94]